MDPLPNQKCVFFDRDGVVNRSPGAGYVTRPKDFHLNDGLVEVMQLLAERDFVAVLVTSQRCVGKGLLSSDGLDEIHLKLQSSLAQHGLGFLDIYAFLGTPETASWEKPNPDMILLAAEKHEIDLSASWMIGDADRDIVMGQRAGVGRTLRIITDKAVGVDADFTAKDLLAANAILTEQLA
ncbi:MAG: D-glycero-D-manno-heptose 1,7-bisphosphate phosphatase [Verrucomicrobiales bacterium]